MRVGLHLPNSGTLTSNADLVQMAVDAEQAGFDAVWVFDHLFNPVELSPATRRHRPDYYNKADMPYFDALTTLSVAAGATATIGLGTRVLLPVLRSPVALAKQIATLACLAGPGRLTVGVGSGWLLEEFEAVGIDPDERFSRLDEHVAIMRDAWTRGITSHSGRFYSHAPAGFHPIPTEPIPILLGGGGPATIRRIARWADGWAMPNIDPGPGARAELSSLLGRLRAACDDAGRDVGEIRLVVGSPLSAPDEHFELLREFSIDDVDLMPATAAELDIDVARTALHRIRALA